MNNLDLNKLEQKLDDALSNETSESLTNWLEEKKMTNNKAREYTSPLIEELLNEVTPEEMERTNREMENMDWYIYPLWKVQRVRIQEVEKWVRNLLWVD